MIEEIMNRREPEFKELSFDTALRNPERYYDLFEIIQKYNGIILNDNNILNIMLDLYENKIITSPLYDSERLNDDVSRKNKIIEINSTRNSDGGYPRGYQSRFWTYMRTPSEFGFVYAKYNKIFLLADVTQKMIKGEIDVQESFSLQAIKFNRRSPYRNVSNDYNYFRFIINILKELEKQNKKMTYNQFVLTLFDKEGNVDEFIKTINQMNFNDSQKTYEYIKNNYPSVNKYQTVMNDYPDVVLRMLRITGFVNIQNNGIILLELNSSNKNYIEQLLQLNYKLSDEEKNYSEKYYEKINVVHENELKIIISNRKTNKSIENYNLYMKNIISNYNLDKNSIINYLKCLYTGRESSIDSRFKYITNPLKLEFFVSLFMYILYGNEYVIKPNYKIDDYGIPISHAPGNMGDIEIINKDSYWLLEVTLIRNRIQQLNNESINLFRHINGEKYRYKYLSLIAPYIHDDTTNLFKAATILELSENGLKNFYAKPYAISEFVEIAKKKHIFSDMENFTIDILKRLKELFEEYNI